MRVQRVWWMVLAMVVLVAGGCGVEQGEEPIVIEEEGPPYAPEWDEGEPLGGERAARLSLPRDYHVNRQWPLVIALHGYSASPAWIDGFLGVSGQVNEGGFIGLMPPGTVGAGDLSFWNATEACCDFADSGVDDVAYLSELMDEAMERLAVDPERIYFMGHSNGGFMSYRMACEFSDRIRGVAVVAGSSFEQAADCGAEHPLSVLHIHGDADTVIPYEGGRFGADRFPGAEEVSARWAARNGCAESPVAGDALDLALSRSGAETEVKRWTDCEGGAEVELWSMRGVEHNPTLSTLGKRAIFDFMLRQR